MPDQSQCINPSSPGSPAEPPAVPPVLDPAKWEDFPAFREIFLMYFTEPPANSALRIFGRLHPEEVIGLDLQEMRNIHERLKPRPWIASDWGRGDR